MWPTLIHAREPLYLKNVKYYASFEIALGSLWLRSGSVHVDTLVIETSSKTIPIKCYMFNKTTRSS